MRNHRVLSKASVAIALAIGMLASSPLLPFSAASYPPPSLFVTTNTTLTQDLNESIVVGASNLTLDCAFHIVTYHGGKIGILVESLTNVTIRDCRALGFETGYALVSSTGIVLVGDVAAHSLTDGFLVTASGNSLIQDNATANGGNGFTVSVGNVLAFDAAWGNGVDGFHVNADNAVNESVAAGNGNNGFTLAGFRNVLAGDAAVGNTRDGFDLASGNRLEGSTADRNGNDGISVVSASEATLVANTANGNRRIGFYFSSSHKNTVTSNAACGNGIVDAFQDNTSSGNVFVNNVFCTMSGIDPPPPVSPPASPSPLPPRPSPSWLCAAAAWPRTPGATARAPS